MCAHTWYVTTCSAHTVNIDMQCMHAHGTHMHMLHTHGACTHKQCTCAQCTHMVHTCGTQCTWTYSTCMHGTHVVHAHVAHACSAHSDHRRVVHAHIWYTHGAHGHIVYAHMWHMHGVHSHRHTCPPRAHATTHAPPTCPHAHLPHTRCTHRHKSIWSLPTQQSPAQQWEPTLETCSGHGLPSTLTGVGVVL